MRSVLTSSKWKNLDMVEISSVKRNKFMKKNLMVFVNGEPFFRGDRFLLKEDNRYAFAGILESVWNLIEEKKYQEASSLLEEILPTVTSSSSLFLAKFTTSLFLGEDAFFYLKRTIETKESSSEDEFYFLYLELYRKMEKDYEVDSLEDYLVPPKKHVIVGANSYNGRYQTFLDALASEDYQGALEKLNLCFEMKKDFLPLEIAKCLLTMLMDRQEEMRLQKEEQEKKLEEGRIDAFLRAVDEKNIPRAKKELERILAYREASSLDNHAWYLFLELLEMMESSLADPTFEYVDVNHVYEKEDNAFYTFQEAISLGDFKKALEAGKKCRRRSFDKEIPTLKVSHYLDLLEYFFKILTEREKEIETTYQIIQVNIEKMHYTHAFHLYQENEKRLLSYEKRLIEDLFQAGIKLEKGKREEVSLEEPPKLVFPHQETLELDSFPEESGGLEELPLEDLEERKDIIEEKEEIKEEETFYPVEPLLPHFLPHQEYFLYFLQYYQAMRLEEARYWLTQYDQLLRSNRIKKRLDQFYYSLEVMSMELMEPVEKVKEKENAYSYAYNEMRHHRFEKALEYLSRYQQLDEAKNQKGWILKGYIHSQLGQYQEAIAAFIEANSLAPNPDAYYFLGEIYYKQKRWNDAIFCYVTYNEFYPKEDISVYLNLSECYKNLGKTFKTLKYLRQAEEINREQNLGYNLIKRILKTEMLNVKKKEKVDFDLNQNLEKEKEEG